MLPFLPPFPNQNQVQRGNDPSSNQFPSSSSVPTNQLSSNNHQMLTQAMGGFNNQNALLSTLLTQQQLMQGLQNNLMGALLQQGIMPQLQGQQLNLFGALQNPNFMSLMGQNLNQMMGFSPNGLSCSPNPIYPPNSQLPVIGSANSNPNFLGNCSTQVGKNLSSSKSLENQTASRNLQEPILPGPVQNNQFKGRQWPQMTHGGKNFPSNAPENVATNNFKPKVNGHGKREPSHMRFQKSQSYNSRKAWQKERGFPKNNQKGPRQRKESISAFSASINNTPIMRKRPLSVVYTESEIQQWREARKKNFPTRTNIEKKLSFRTVEKEDLDSCSKLRRQELKEVLAKQAELGVEIAEIPSIYLTEPDDQIPANLNSSKALNTVIETPCKGFRNNKRSRFRRNNRNGKRPKFNHAAAPPEPVVKKREPTLLRKLLNADIRRDRSQLLQAFRFMVLNSFFKGGNDKPLVFPIITAKDVDHESEMVVEKKKCLNKIDSDDDFVVKNENVEVFKRNNVVGEVNSECDDDNDDNDDIDDASDVVCETVGEEFILHDGEKSEEGEITD